MQKSLKLSTLMIIKIGENGTECIVRNSLPKSNTRDTAALNPYVENWKISTILFFLLKDSPIMSLFVIIYPTFRYKDIFVGRNNHQNLFISTQCCDVCR